MLRSRRILIYFCRTLLDPQSTQCFCYYIAENQTSLPGCCNLHLQPHAPPPESVLAICHLTFTWIKARFILCNSSSNQHFNQSNFQNACLLKRVTSAVHRGRQKKKQWATRCPQLHLKTPPDFSVHSPILFNLPLLRRLSKVSLSSFFPPWDIKLLSILTTVKQIIKNE